MSFQQDTRLVVTRLFSTYIDCQKPLQHGFLKWTIGSGFSTSQKSGFAISESQQNL